jgi:hypothetical protein
MTNDSNPILRHKLSSSFSRIDSLLISGVNFPLINSTESIFNRLGVNKACLYPCIPSRTSSLFQSDKYLAQ